MAAYDGWVRCPVDHSSHSPLLISGVKGELLSTPQRTIAYSRVLTSLLYLLAQADDFNRQQTVK